ncbi:MAG: Stk1 family PASTA domain-containing Ser/Thr kinase [Lachnospiraceae bacterium]|nr:Stk1 family PASTA domain-containing Ser/Thr kinase [Lachnospiraceae bacterium]
MMINPGTVLGNRYEVEELIGTGGMANVYKASDRKLNRKVAIKVLKDEYSSNKNFVSKFKAEAQAAAGLMHPNIVNVYDVGDENGIYYFVMELVEGITLKNYIEKKIRLSIKEATSIAIQVSMGIEAAHNNGIIHRDIKPQNIIISRDGKVKVADFGIARAATSDTITTHAMGSVHYTSPEQARGGYSDAKSDIYSIGITLFEMVTGRVPFDGETTVSIAIKHIQEEMPSPRTYVPEIPISIEQIIFKCTQKHPDMRYANISELIADLKRSLINPDENFVVINDAASNAGTRTITDSDRAEIRNQTLAAGVSSDYEERQREPYDNGGQYRDQNPYHNDGMYGNSGAYHNDPSYRDPGAYHQDMAYHGEGSYQEHPYGDPYRNPYGMVQEQVYNGQGYEGQFREEHGSYPQKDPYRNPYNDRNASMAEEDDDDDLLDFLITPGKVGEKQPNKVNPPQKNKKSPEPQRPVKNRNEDRNNNANKGRKPSGKDPFDETFDEDSTLNPKMEKAMSILIVGVAIVVAIIAILAVSRAFNLFDSKDKLAEGETTVPNVVGMTIDEAQNALVEAGLKATATYAESNVYDKDIISGQNPVADTVVEEGTTLELVISSGLVQAQSEATLDISPGTMTAVPDVVGLSKAEAKVKLENEGFTVEIEEISDPSAAAGAVVKQSPMGAENAVEGSKVLIYINGEKGTAETEEEEKPKTQVSVPDLVGKDEDSAKQLLSELKLTYQTINEEPNDAVQPGLVLSQSIAAGTMVDEETTVDFTISKGPSTYSCNFSITAPADYLAGTEAVIVLTGITGAEVGRFSTTQFPYALVQTGITGTDSGIITVTYQMLDGNWNTTSPVAVTFTRDQ